jgi:RNA-dependent RNA polymerase
LWEAFSKEGEICSIDIFDDRHGNRGSKGRVRFKYVLISSLTCFPLFLAILRFGKLCRREMLINLHPKQASSSKVLLAEWNL